MSSATLESINSKVLQFLFALHKTEKVVGDIPTPPSCLELKLVGKNPRCTRTPRKGFNIISSTGGWLVGSAVLEDVGCPSCGTRWGKKKKPTQPTKSDFWQNPAEQVSPTFAPFKYAARPLSRSGSLPFFDQCPSPACVDCVHLFWSACGPH